MKVYFDIITNHTADVHRLPGSAYDSTGQCPYKTKATRPTRTPHGHAFDDRDFTSAADPFPADRPATSASPTRRSSRPRPTRRPRCRPGSTTRRCTTTAATRPSPARTASTATSSASTTSSPSDPQVVKGMIDIYKTGSTIRRRRLPHRHRQARQHGLLAAVRPGPAGPRGAMGNDGLLHVRRGLRRRPARSCRSTRPTGQAAGDARLRLPGQRASTSPRAGARPSCATSSRRRLLHRRRLQRLLAADLPRQPRHGPRRHASCATTPRAGTTSSCCSATSSPTR